MTRVIFQTELVDLARSLSKEARIFVPTKNRPESTFGQYSFQELSDDILPSFDYSVTNLPPKEFLLPPKDILWKFRANSIEKPVTEKQIIFGVSCEDLDGLHRLKKIFEKPTKDEPFFDRADKTIIVAIDHFSPPDHLEYDLYLQKIREGVYAGYAKTLQGKKILKSNLFKDQQIKVPRVSRKNDPLLSNPELPTIIEKAKDHPAWDELANICFGCGICSYVCPMCYCFDVEDEVEITKSEPCGSRCRTWDSCMLASFSETNAGNFRGELSRRIYNWYYHKFVRMPKEYNFSGCVDCNRCVIYCPAKINYRVVLMRLVKEWEAKK